MNIHEYQGKEVLKSFGVAIQEGIVADSPEAAVKAAEELQKQTGTGWWVVKSQIHAGGRGKGKIVGTEQRGVALAKSLDDVKTITTNIFLLRFIFERNPKNHFWTFTMRQFLLT